MRQALIEQIRGQALDDALRGSIATVTGLGAGGDTADLSIGGSVVPRVPVAAGVTVSLGQVVLAAKLGSAWLVISGLRSNGAKPNLLPNPGFEADAQGSRSPTAWTTDRFTGSGSPGTVGAGRTGVGGFTVPLLGGVTQYLALAAPVAVTPGKAYRIGLWSRASAPLAPGEGLTVQVWPGESASQATWPGVTLMAAPVSPAWQEASVQWTAPAASQGVSQVWARVALVWAGGPTTRGVSVTVDDLSMQEA